MYLRNRFLAAVFFAAANFSFGACSRAGLKSETVTEAKTINAAETDQETAAALKMIDAEPDSTKGYLLLASIYIKRARSTGDFSLNEKAKSATEKSLAIDPANALARKLDASLLATFHRFADARVAATTLKKEFPDDPFVYGVLTDANVELGNYTEAIEFAQKMVDLKPNSASYARVAYIRSLNGDHTGSVEAYRLAARTADPADREAQAWCLSQLGDELWKNGRYGESNAVLDEALRIFPGYNLALAGKGRVLASMGDFERAAKTLVEAQNRIPNADTVILLGDVYTKLGDTEKAAQQAALLEAVIQKLGLAGDQKQLALYWADHDTKLGEALEIAEREYGRRKDIFTADVYAWVLFKNNRISDAARLIEQAMRLKTGDARILFHAGMIAKARGSKTEAKRLLALALATNPVFDLKQSEVAKQTLETL